MKVEGMGGAGRKRERRRWEEIEEREGRWERMVERRGGGVRRGLVERGRRG